MAASIILSKCDDGRTFGIRIEKRGNDWVRTWAFPVDEAKGKREGYHKTKIKGSLDAMPEYPGCPHCGENGFVQCPCGKIFCYKENNESVKSEKKMKRQSNIISIRCPWCGKKSTEIETVESFSVKSGGF